MSDELNRAAQVAQLDADLPPLPIGDEAGRFSSTCIVYAPGQVRQYGRKIAGQYVERIRHLEREAGLLSLVADQLKARVAAADAHIERLEAAERGETAQLRRCKPCHSPRKGRTCHKCGGPTFVPHSTWEEPALPPVDRIRELAREVGYAIGEHGTKERDLDLIAAPWTEEAIGNHALFEHIAKGLGARIVEVERKPLGRYAATLQMDGWYKNIDLSVCPFDGRTAGTAPAKLTEWAALSEETDEDWSKGYEAARAYVRMQLAAAPSITAGTASEAAPEGLTAAEAAFVELVRASPGAKLSDGQAWGPDNEPLWHRPEALGLIECVGSYKWRAAAPSTQEGANEN